MSFCTVTWSLDTLAKVHAVNRDAAVLVTLLKMLTDMARKRSRDDTPEVVLASRRTAMFGLSARRTRKALEALEKARIVSLRQEPGKAVRVRLDPSTYRELKVRSKGGWALA
jgi:DNA-binding transcriptional ArsR family regulator